MVDLLLAKGARVNDKTSDENTPLYQAVYKDNIEIVKLLLAKGVDMYVSSHSGRTPIDYASYLNRTKIFNYFIAHINL